MSKLEPDEGDLTLTLTLTLSLEPDEGDSYCEWADSSSIRALLSSASTVEGDGVSLAIPSQKIRALNRGVFNYMYMPASTGVLSTTLVNSNLETLKCLEIS